MAIHLMEWQKIKRLGASAKSPTGKIRHHRCQERQKLIAWFHWVRQSLPRHLDEEKTLLGKRSKACQGYRSTRFL